jgi:hypothetical protein
MYSHAISICCSLGFSNIVSAADDKDAKVICGSVFYQPTSDYRSSGAPNAGLGGTPSSSPDLLFSVDGRAGAPAAIAIGDRDEITPDQYNRAYQVDFQLRDLLRGKEVIRVCLNAIELPRSPHATRDVVLVVNIAKITSAPANSYDCQGYGLMSKILEN